MTDSLERRLSGGPTNGGECPGCGRVMSVREGTEQGVCNDCLVDGRA